MKNMKKSLFKALALLLIVALTATATLGITLAVLSDSTEIKHNVFTAGNVSVELTEKVDGETAGGVSKDGDIGKYLLVTPGDELTKEVKVKNTGNVPAYVAVTVTMNNAREIWKAIDEWYENDPYNYNETQVQAIYDEIFEGWGLNYTKTDAAGNATGMRLTITGDDMPAHTLQVDSVKTADEYSIPYTQNWFQNTQDVIPFDGYYTEGMDTYEFKWTYYLYLEANQSSTLFTGINVPMDFTNEQNVMFDGLKIDIAGAAIQAENFATAQEAFAALHDLQLAPVADPNATAIVDDADGLVEALENNQDVLMSTDVKINPAGMSNAYGTTGINVKSGQTIDGGGNILDIAGAGGTWDSGISTTGGIIKDITVTGSFRGVFINHNSTHAERVVLENVIIDGTSYTISCDQGTGNGLTATNSTFNGWTSYADTLGDAKFVDCSFGEGNGYEFCRPYAPTEFVNCNFEAGYELEALAAVTFENCTLNGVPLTTANIADLVCAGLANVTVK